MSEHNPIYQKYSGNIKSDKLTVLLKDGKYVFVYQKFIRSNPCQAQRKLGKKPKRTLVSEQIFEFTNIKNMDFSEYPFSHLVDF